MAWESLFYVSIISTLNTSIKESGTSETETLFPHKHNRENPIRNLRTNAEKTSTNTFKIVDSSPRSLFPFSCLTYYDCHYLNCHIFYFVSL